MDSMLSIAIECPCSPWTVARIDKSLSPISALPNPLINRDEHLRTGRLAPFRSEYRSGRVVAMAGTAPEHSRIVTNIPSTLDFQLKDRRCNNDSQDLRVSARGGDRYLYPDAVDTCGDEIFEDGLSDTLVNPPWSSLKCSPRRRRTTIAGLGFSTISRVNAKRPVHLAPLPFLLGRLGSPATVVGDDPLDNSKSISGGYPTRIYESRCVKSLLRANLQCKLRIRDELRRSRSG